jgi:hypothetical protein
MLRSSSLLLALFNLEQQMPYIRWALPQLYDRYFPNLGFDTF